MSTRLPDDLDDLSALDARLDRELTALAEGIVVRPDPARLLRHLDAAGARPAGRPVGPRLLAAAAVALMVGGAGLVATRSPGGADGPATTPTSPSVASSVPPVASSVAPSSVATTVATTAAPAPATAAAPATAPATPAPAAADGPDGSTAHADPAAGAAADTTAPAPTPEPATTVPPPPATTAAPAPEPEPEPTVPATTAAPTVAFTAGQAFGSCDENPPYDEFSGTATPGTRITVTSPYGGGSVTADGSGHWWVKVTFPSAPAGETFSVRVAGPQGQRTFSFVRTA